MLAVGIHRQGVREAGLARGLERVQHGGALADVARQHLDAQARVVGRHRAQPVGRAVAAAVDDDPHRRPGGARGANRVVDERRRCRSSG